MLKMPLSNKKIAEKCFLGSHRSIERAGSCVELAKQCNEELKKLPRMEREDFRQELVNEIAPINKLVHSREKNIRINSSLGEELEEYYLKPRGEEIKKEKSLKKYITRPYIKTTHQIHGEPIDEKEYIEKHGDVPFGSCHLALYGSEKLYLDEVKKEFPQSKVLEKTYRNIDRLVFWDEGDQDEKSFFIKNELYNPRIKNTNFSFDTIGTVYTPEHHLFHHYEKSFMEGSGEHAKRIPVDPEQPWKGYYHKKWKERKKLDITYYGYQDEQWGMGKKSRYTPFRMDMKLVQDYLNDAFHQCFLRNEEQERTFDCFNPEDYDALIKVFNMMDAEDYFRVMTNTLTSDEVAKKEVEHHLDHEFQDSNFDDLMRETLEPRAVDYFGDVFDEIFNEDYLKEPLLGLLKLIGKEPEDFVNTCKVIFPEYDEELKGDYIHVASGKSTWQEEEQLDEYLKWSTGMMMKMMEQNPYIPPYMIIDKLVKEYGQYYRVDFEIEWDLWKENFDDLRKDVIKKTKKLFEEYGRDVEELNVHLRAQKVLSKKSPVYLKSIYTEMKVIKDLSDGITRIRSIDYKYEEFLEHYGLDEENERAVFDTFTHDNSTWQRFTRESLEKTLIDYLNELLSQKKQIHKKHHESLQEMVASGEISTADAFFEEFERTERMSSFLETVKNLEKEYNAFLKNMGMFRRNEEIVTRLHWLYEE